MARVCSTCKHDAEHDSPVRLGPLQKLAPCLDGDAGRDLATKCRDNAVDVPIDHNPDPDGCEQAQDEQERLSKEFWKYLEISAALLGLHSFVLYLVCTSRQMRDFQVSLTQRDKVGRFVPRPMIYRHACSNKPNQKWKPPYTFSDVTSITIARGSECLSNSAPRPDYFVCSMGGARITTVAAFLSQRIERKDG